MAQQIRYPNISVELVGGNGNAYVILGKVERALLAAEIDNSEIENFMAEATSGDYDHLLQTVMMWVDVI